MHRGSTCSPICFLTARRVGYVSTNRLLLHGARYQRHLSGRAVRLPLRWPPQERTRCCRTGRRLTCLRLGLRGFQCVPSRTHRSFSKNARCRSSASPWHRHECPYQQDDSITIKAPEGAFIYSAGVSAGASAGVSSEGVSGAGVSVTSAAPLFSSSIIGLRVN